MMGFTTISVPDDTKAALRRYRDIRTHDKARLKSWGATIDELLANSGVCLDETPEDVEKFRNW